MADTPRAVILIAVAVLLFIGCIVVFAVVPAKQNDETTEKLMGNDSVQVRCYYGDYVRVNLNTIATLLAWLQRKA